MWLNFLHFYQPANSSLYRINEAVEKSYWRLITILKDNPELKFTANISACLLERLKDEGFIDLLTSFIDLINEGRLEIVGSAAYHGFLPFLPITEVEYQIRRQEELTQEILGVDLKGGGFFFPEMAYTPKLAKLVKRLGYTWIIVDEASVNSDKYEAAVIDTNSSLEVIVRSRSFSNAYLPDLVNNDLNNNLPKLIVTATDSELYGLRHQDPTRELEKMIGLDKLETATISEFLNQKKSLNKFKLKSASWETNHLKDKNSPFIIWNNPKNIIHRDLWRLAALAIQAGKDFSDDKSYEAYRWHLDRGLASCMFWWASGADFSHNFGPVAWNPDEVESILNDLIKSVRSLSSQDSLVIKLKAEKLINHIQRDLWRSHWSNHWRSNSEKN